MEMILRDVHGYGELKVIINVQDEEVFIGERDPLLKINLYDVVRLVDGLSNFIKGYDNAPFKNCPTCGCVFDTCTSNYCSRCGNKLKGE